MANDGVETKGGSGVGSATPLRHHSLEVQERPREGEKPQHDGNHEKVEGQARSAVVRLWGCIGPGGAGGRRLGLGSHGIGRRSVERREWIASERRTYSVSKPGGSP